MERNNYIHWTRSKILSECKSNRAIYGQIDKPLICWKDSSNDNWSRVQEMRLNEHPLILGGKKS